MSLARSALRGWRMECLSVTRVHGDAGRVPRDIAGAVGALQRGLGASAHPGPKTLLGTCCTARALPGARASAAGHAAPLGVGCDAALA